MGSVSCISLVHVACRDVCWNPCAGRCGDGYLTHITAVQDLGGMIESHQLPHDGHCSLLARCEPGARGWLIRHLHRP